MIASRVLERGGRPPAWVATPWASQAAIWVAVLAAAGVLAVVGPGATFDTGYFLRASHTLLSARWSRTFAAPGVQAGPLEILSIGLAGKLGIAAGSSAEAGVRVLQSLGLTALLLVGATAVCPRRRRPLVVGVVGAAALATGTVSGAFFYGHPAEVANPVLWVVAAAAFARRRPWLAGVLVGVSAGLETWGLLGIALLVARRTRARDTGLAVAAALAVVVAVYGPFVASGHFAMLSYRWQISPASVPALVVGAGGSFGWPFRLVQAAVACGTGAAASVFLRRAAAAWWVAPLCIVSTKLALDPQPVNAWYLLAPQTVALLGAAQLAGSLLANGSLPAREPALKPSRLAADSSAT